MSPILRAPPDHHLSPVLSGIFAGSICRFFVGAAGFIGHLLLEGKRRKKLLADRIDGRTEQVSRRSWVDMGRTAINVHYFFF